ncbi:MAG: hypothetical protein FJ027_16635 [Candidatus Rokubacteria bacterium]|nr:hypothetical protein [Candidatus Rokubacteria bacterium]
MDFVIRGAIESRRVLAAGASVRARYRLNERFGVGRWRKMAGEATIEYDDGTVERAEIHWFEAHGIGRVLFKRKRNAEQAP